jgi:hypothetical protein
MSKKLNFKIVNGRTVRLNNVKDFYEELGDNDEVVRIYTDSGIEIKLGDTIHANRGYPHRVNHILRGKVDSRIVCYDLISTKSTSSTTFVTPFLGVSKSLMLWDTLFVNTYVNVLPDHEKCIALLYRFSGDAKFLKFESALCSFRTFVKKYDPDPYHVLFVFDVPDSAKKSYQRYLDGEYSEIDGLWKLKILDFHDYDRYGHTGQILHRDDELREKIETKLDVTLPPGSELHSRPDMDVETYNPELFKVSKALST